MMRYLLLLIIPSILFSQAPSTYNPQDANTVFLLSGSLGKTLVGDSVSVWVDQQNSLSFEQRTEPDTAKPINGSDYVEARGWNFLGSAVDDTVLDITAADYTISARFEVYDASQATGRYILSKHETPSNFTIFLYVISNYIRTAHRAGGSYIIQGYTGAGTILDSTEYIVNATWDRDGSVQFYINGDSSTTTTSDMGADAIDFDEDVVVFNRNTDGADFAFDGKLYWIQVDSTLRSVEWISNFNDYVVGNVESETTEEPGSLLKLKQLKRLSH